MESDRETARDLLASGGMPLDRISASIMRRVVEGVGKIAQGVLDQADGVNEQEEPE